MKEKKALNTVEKGKKISIQNVNNSVDFWIDAK